MKITDERLATLDFAEGRSGGSAPLEEERYWIAATKAESLVALGDPSGPGLMQAALASAPAGWMADTTRNQLDKLHALLAKARRVRRSFAGSRRAAPGDPSGERLMRKRPRAPRPSGWPIRRKASSGVSGPCSKART